MNKGKLVIAGLLAVAMLFAASPLIAQDAKSTDEQMAGLEAMCAKSSKARAERHEQKSLYLRLGGYEKIHKLTKEIVRLHLQNDSIKHMFVGVDTDMLAKHVADFVAAGTGGDAVYKGRDMPSSHAHLKLTNADFLSAGGDIIKAMQNLGYGQNEIDEVICILVSLKDQVVLE